MTRRWLLPVLLILSGLVLAWSLMDFVRQAFVIPLTVIYLFAARLYASLNQPAAWAFYLVFLAIIAVASLVRVGQSRLKREPIETDSQGRVATISRWLDMRRKGDYFKWRLANYLTQLTLDLVAVTEGIPVAEVKDQVLDQELAIPTEIQNYLQAGLRSRSIDITHGYRQHDGGRPRVSPLKMDPELIVRFLEEHFDAEGSEAEHEG